MPQPADDVGAEIVFNKKKLADLFGSFILWCTGSVNKECFRQAVEIMEAFKFINADS